MAIIASIMLRMGADAKPLLDNLSKGEAAIGRFASRSNQAIGKNAGTGVLGGVAQAGSFGLGGAARAGVSFALASAGITGVIAIASRASRALADGVRNASSLNETLSKTQLMLGPAAPAVEAFADKMGEQFGLVKKDVLDAASSFGGLAQSLGNLKGDNVANFATQFTKLAADISSVSDQPLDEAAKALTIGLSGEQSDILKRLGVILNETTLGAYALAHGLDDDGKKLDEATKFAARSGIILEKLGKVSGDLERTANSPANLMRKVSGQFQNLGVSIGQALLPALTRGLGLFSRFAGVTLGAFNSVKGGIASFASGVVGAVEFVADRIGAFASLARPAFDAALASVSAFVEGTTAAIHATLIPGFMAIGEAVSRLPANLSAALGPEASSMVETFAGAVVANVTAAFGFARTFVVDAIDVIGFAWRNLPDLIEVGGLMIAEHVLNLGAHFSAFGTNVGLMGQWFADNFVNLLIDGLNAVSTGFINLGKNAASLWEGLMSFARGEGFHVEFTPLLEGFNSTLSELPKMVDPAFVSLQGQIDEKLAAISARETDRAQEIARGVRPSTWDQGEFESTWEQGAFGIPGEEGSGVEGGKEKKVAANAAVEFGSKEAGSALAKFYNEGSGGGDDKPIRDVAKTTREQLVESRKQSSTLEQILAKSGTTLSAYTI